MLWISNLCVRYFDKYREGRDVEDIFFVFNNVVLRGGCRCEFN